MKGAKAMNRTVVALAACVGIVVLESIALTKGYDGQILALALAALSGLGGWNLARFFSKKEAEP